MAGTTSPPAARRRSTTALTRLITRAHPDRNRRDGWIPLAAVQEVVPGALDERRLADDETERIRQPGLQFLDDRGRRVADGDDELVAAEADRQRAAAPADLRVEEPRVPRVPVRRLEVDVLEAVLVREGARELLLVDPGVAEEDVAEPSVRRLAFGERLGEPAGVEQTTLEQDRAEQRPVGQKHGRRRLEWIAVRIDCHFCRQDRHDPAAAHPRKGAHGSGLTRDRTRPVPHLPVEAVDNAVVGDARKGRPASAARVYDAASTSMTRLCRKRNQTAHFS